MKVEIGPYLTYWGPYQFTDLLQHIGVSEDKCFELGGKLPECVSDVCQWVYDKRKRKVIVKLDQYDTWSVYSTLSYIIVPLLKQLKKEQHGYPSEFCDEQEYSPQHSFVGEGFQLEEDSGAKEWDKVLDKMIWAFEQTIDDGWESQYYTGEFDYRWEDTSDEDLSELVKGPNHTSVCDHVGLKKHHEQMQEGFDLFGKHYQSLWD